MEHFSILPVGRKFSIVSFGSQVRVGPMSLAALKAPKGTKTENLTLEDARILKMELEKLMEDKLSETKRSCKK